MQINLKYVVTNLLVINKDKITLTDLLVHKDNSLRNLVLALMGRF